jgi:hypothetical protein
MSGEGMSSGSGPLILGGNREERQSSPNQLFDETSKFMRLGPRLEMISKHGDSIALSSRSSSKRMKEGLEIEWKSSRESDFREGKSPIDER